jgi:hypothetical protein
MAIAPDSPNAARITLPRGRLSAIRKFLHANQINRNLSMSGLLHPWKISDDTSHESKDVEVSAAVPRPFTGGDRGPRRAARIRDNVFPISGGRAPRG